GLHARQLRHDAIQQVLGVADDLAALDEFKGREARLGPDDDFLLRLDALQGIRGRRRAPEGNGCDRERRQQAAPESGVDLGLHVNSLGCVCLRGRSWPDALAGTLQLAGRIANWTSLGRPSLTGTRSCGQAENAMIRSISARNETYWPASLSGGPKARSPSSSTGMFMNRLSGPGTRVD